MLEDCFADIHIDIEEKQELTALISSISHEPERLSFIRNQAFKLVSRRLEDEESRKALKCLKDLMVLIDKQRPETDPVEAFFTHHSDPLRIIQREINACKYSIDICVFTITDNRISELIKQAHKNGIKIRIISDNEKLHDKGSDIESLHRAGIPIAIDDGEEHMHHKFAIFDGHRLLNGSYNWTRGASEKNYENFLISENQELLIAYKAEFERLWEQFERYN